MFRMLALGAVLLTGAAAHADEALPVAIDCYQTATNGQDIDAYMGCFTDDAVMIDVSRTFEGKDAIRAWAQREVIKGGESFKHRKILESSDGFAKTEVNWLSWVVHYSYWWDADGRITKMSLQYAD
ncbi:nuclear transport factor 2 family protein [Hoeflea sp.]|uniref:nuclear transport factor 2 family protein n=1 Tax=Hoeflea sp. TaxID=1940281 RepID=UPI003B01FE74